MTSRRALVACLCMAWVCQAPAQDVDPWSGRLTLSVRDVSVDAGTIAIEVVRTHAASERSFWGEGWRASWDVRAWISTGEVLVCDGAMTVLLAAERDGRFGNAAAGVFARAGDAWVWSRADGGRDEFDREGRLVRRTARDGTAVALAYDAGGRLKELRGPFGASLAFAWSADGALASIRASDGQEVRYGYASNRLARIWANGAETASYAFDEAGRLAAVAEPGTGPQRFTYDREGRVTARAWAGGAAETYERDVARGRARRIGALGGATVYERSPDGRRETVTAPDGPAVVRELDTAGRVLRVADGRGTTLQSSAYDALGRIVRIEDASGRATVFGYAGDSRDLASLTGPDGVVETYLYDDRGRVLRVQRGGRTVEEREYRKDGLLARRTRGAAWEAWTYDAAGRVASVRASDGRHTVYTRDARGRVMREVDAAGQVVERAYDEQGRVVAETRAPGGVTRYEYGAQGLLVRRTDPSGGVTVYRHDARGWLAEIVHADGGTNRYGYDRAGQLVSVTDPAGHTTRFEYDPAGNLVREIDPGGRILQRAWDAMGNLVMQTDRAGGRSTQAFDAAGRLVKTVNEAGGVTTYAYDDHGVSAITDPIGRVFQIACSAGCRIRTERDADGRTWRHEFDEEGRRTRLTSSLGGVTEWVYDEAGRLQRVRKPGGGELRYAYDAAGRLARVTDPAGDTTDYAYDARGLLVAETAGDGRVTRYEYDAEGRRTRTVLPGGAARVFAYDAAGRMIRFADADGVETRHVYDVAGRRVQSILSTGLAIHFGYDASGEIAWTSNTVGEAEFFARDGEGRLVGYSNRLGRARSLVRDPRGLLTEERDALGQVATYRYDAAGQLVAAREPNGDEARVEYDAAGRVRSVRSPGGGAQQYVLQEKDGVVRAVDALGRVTSNAYDGAGRLVRSWNARGQQVSYAYDEGGRLVRREGAAGAVGFEVDRAGGVTRVDDAGFPVRMAYAPGGLPERVEYGKARAALRFSRDALGRRVRMEAPGHAVEYRYDASGRLASLKVGDAVLEFGIDALGRLASLRYPNGLSVASRYDAAGDLEGLRLSAPVGGAASEWTLHRDAVGQIARIKSTEGDWAYAYDAAGQLVSEAGPYGLIRYAYAPGGNRSQVSVGREASAWKVNAADQVIAAGGETFSYDADGNLVERSGPGGRTRYVFDDANRLVQAVLPDGRTIDYGYDYQGLRVWRRDADGLRYFIYDGVNLVAELDERGAVLAAYVHGFMPNQPLLQLRGGGVFALHADANGNIVRMTDARGATVATWAYDAFGVPRGSTGTAPCAFRFQGHEWDESTGLYYCRARWYDPALGRFLSRDPLPGQPMRPLSLNVYAFALNNPVRYRDPMGAAAQSDVYERGGASAEAQGVFGGLSSATPYGTPAPSPNAIPVPGPNTYTVTPLGANDLGAYYHHDPNVGSDIQIDPRAGSTQNRFDGVVVHETQHRVDANRAQQAMANRLDHGLDPANAADRKFLHDRLLRTDPDYMARLERRAIEKQTTFLVRDRGLGVRAPEVREALDYFDQFGNRDQKGRLVQQLERFEREPVRLGNTRFQTFMQGANVAAVVLQIGSCLEMGRDPVDCAKEAAIAGVAGHLIGAAIAASGLNPAVVLAAAGIHGWVQVGREAGAQWRDYTNNAAMAAANQAQQQVNDGRVQQTLGELRAKLGALRALASEAASLYQSAVGQAQAAASSARGGPALVAEARAVETAVGVAAAACPEAEQLRGTLETRAGNAERYEGLIEDGINAAKQIAANCNSKADADRITDLYTTAAHLLAGIQAMEAESKIDSARIRQIVEVQTDAKARIAQIEGHPATIGQKVKDAKDALAKATTGFADFEKKRVEAEGAKQRLIGQIAALRGAHSAQFAGDFDALQGEASAVAIQGPSSGEALNSAQSEISLAETAQSDAESAVKAAKGAQLCESTSPGDEFVGRIGSAYAGAFISFGTGIDLPAQAQACAQAASSNAPSAGTDTNQPAGGSGDGSGDGTGDGGGDGGGAGGGTGGGTGWDGGPADPGGGTGDVSNAGTIQQGGGGSGPDDGGPMAGSGTNSVPVGGDALGGDLPGQEQSNRTTHIGRPGDHTGRPQSGMGTGPVTDPGAALTNATGQAAGAAQAAGQAVDGLTGDGRKPPTGGSSTNTGAAGSGGGKPPGSGGTGKPPTGSGGGAGGGGGSGGGSGGGTNAPPPGGSGTGGTVVVTGTGTAGGTSGASGSGAGGYSAAPQDQVIDGSAQLAGRAVAGVKVTVTYDALSIPDQFQIIYQNVGLADSGMVSYGGQITGQGSGNSAQVTIRVISSSNQGTQWSWSASVEYYLK